jgi:hypothetical protein
MLSHPSAGEISGLADLLLHMNEVTRSGNLTRYCQCVSVPPHHEFHCHSVWYNLIDGSWAIALIMYTTRNGKMNLTGSFVLLDNILNVQLDEKMA